MCCFFLAEFYDKNKKLSSFFATVHIVSVTMEM